jgi:hypothetical protein
MSLCIMDELFMAQAPTPLKDSDAQLAFGIAATTRPISLALVHH